MANRNKVRQVIEVESFSTAFLKSVLGEKGRLATVNFTKKKDGSVRTLNGKTNVQSALSGGEAAYDAESRGQIRVCDVNLKDANGNRTKGYRTVTAQNVNWVTANGKKYVKVGTGEPVLNFVQGIQYTFATKVLRLVLSGIVYRFFGVPRNIYIGLIDAENKGQYFNQNIKNNFNYVKVV